MSLFVYIPYNKKFYNVCITKSFPKLGILLPRKCEAKIFDPSENSLTSIFKERQNTIPHSGLVCVIFISMNKERKLKLIKKAMPYPEFLGDKFLKLVLILHKYYQWRSEFYEMCILTHSSKFNFYLPPENIRKPRFSDAFRGKRKGALGKNELTWGSYEKRILIHLH